MNFGNLSTERQEYADAIEHLMETGLTTDGSGGRVCAGVFLSLYNSYAFPLNVIDLKLLDDDNWRHAIAAIKGRRRAQCEPHMQIADGERRVVELKEKWAEL